jgi:hypothetical protein
MGFQATPMDVTVQVLAHVVLSDILYNSSLTFQFHGQFQATTHDFWLVPSFLNQTMNGWENTDNKTLNPYYNRRNEITVSHGCLM